MYTHMHLRVGFVVGFSLSVQRSALQSEAADSSSRESAPRARVQQSAICI